MQKINELNKRLLEQLFRMNDVDLLRFCRNVLRSYYDDKVTESQDYVFAEGTIPVAVVAHLDTVFSAPPTEIYYDERQGVMWSPDGLGADDRAGVYAILQLLRRGLRPHVIFTMDEEIGGLGALELVYDHPEIPFKELNYIIEFDRRNINECVFYECTNKAFIRFWESLGFIETVGLYSDIYELCPSWGVAGVNLSVGYRNEHSIAETLFIPALMNVIDRVANLLSDPEKCNIFFKWESMPGFDAIYKQHRDAIFETEFDKSVYCSECGYSTPYYELFELIEEDGSTRLVCCDCLAKSDKWNWCQECGSPFVVDEKHFNENICPKCKAEKGV